MSNTQQIVAAAVDVRLRVDSSKSLLHKVNRDLEDEDLPTLTENELVDVLCDRDPNAPARIRFQVLVSKWDGAAPEEEWTEGTARNSATRRSLALARLGFTEDVRPRINEAFPREPSAVMIVDDQGDWEQWYTPERRSQRDFYWKAYSGLLRDKGWPEDALNKLDNATDGVVGRLADPTWEKPYQAKGLVVGYVQSGKTANFTGVVAKAVDAGYRLVIVLTGTVELLRQQTQRRLDMELVGKENILGGIDSDDAQRLSETDYADDQDWEHGFLEHSVPIHTIRDVPAIRRLTTSKEDYKRLQQGIAALDFRTGHELVEPGKHLFEPVNLFGSDVRLVVIKKNVAALKKLVRDLKDIHTRRGEIPALIIDDESDQASVNTRRQKTAAEKKERTAINREISNLLGLLPRAQYLGYTATPFANVFVDPDDSEDIFPRDFILSLDRPAPYMGASDFHDLDADPDVPKTLDNSNEKAYVRDVYGDPDSDKRADELRAAMDAFVLAGAIKAFRDPTLKRFRHHTMLVHDSVMRSEHTAEADRIRSMWKTAGYDAPAGMQRLAELYERDFVPVTQALTRRGVVSEETAALPETFAQLRAPLGVALNRISKGMSPVIVVNGDSDKDFVRAVQDGLDFQGSDVWKILVGGAKLSRGFTVEGLTTTFYTRRTAQEDTLMQMGRWFGFRDGYRDLVRLHIARAVPGPRGKAFDLYDAFEAAVRDEEAFRGELRRYAVVGEDGKPQVRPQDVPPMVFQQLPWLKPTSPTKMYNARLVSRGAGASFEDFTVLPDRGDGRLNAEHFALVAPLLDALDGQGEFAESSNGGEFEARYGVVEAGAVLDVLEKFHWARSDWFAPDAAFAREAVEAGTLKDFAVVVPLLKGVVEVCTTDGRTVPVVKRKRRKEPRPGFSGSSPRQRAAIKGIADARDSSGASAGLGGELARRLNTGTRGGLLLTFAADTGAEESLPSELNIAATDPRDIATMFHWALPHGVAPRGRIGFTTVRQGGPAIIDLAPGV